VGLRRGAPRRADRRRGPARLLVRPYLRVAVLRYCSAYLGWHLWHLWQLESWLRRKLGEPPRDAPGLMGRRVRTTASAAAAEPRAQEAPRARAQGVPQVDPGAARCRRGARSGQRNRLAERSGESPARACVRRTAASASRTCCGRRSLSSSCARGARARHAHDVAGRRLADAFAAGRALWRDTAPAAGQGHHPRSAARNRAAHFRRERLARTALTAHGDQRLPRFARRRPGTGGALARAGR
jgi:hypothetical protein